MRTNDLLVAIMHSTSHICSTFVTSLIATKYEKCRTSTQRILTSANVEGRSLLHDFNYTVIGMAYGGDHAIEPFRRTLSIPLSYAQSVWRAVDALSLLPLSDSAASANTVNALGMGSSIKPDLFDH